MLYRGLYGPDFRQYAEAASGCFGAVAHRRRLSRSDTRTYGAQGAQRYQGIAPIGLETGRTVVAKRTGRCRALAGNRCHESAKLRRRGPRETPATCSRRRIDLAAHQIRQHSTERKPYPSSATQQDGSRQRRMFAQDSRAVAMVYGSSTASMGRRVQVRKRAFISAPRSLG